MNELSAEDHNKRGISLMEQGHLKPAALEFVKAIQLSSAFADAHSNLGIALTRLGNFQEAILACQRAVQLRTDITAGYIALARVLTKVGRNSEAAAAWRSAIHLNPELVEAHVQLGNLLLNGSAFEPAADSFQQALRYAPQDCEALTGLGNAHLLLRRFDEAEASHRKVIKFFPMSAVGWTNLGNVFRSAGNVDDALLAYEQAIRVDPGFAPAFANLGIILKDRGKPERAIEAFRRSLQLDPSSAALHSNLVYTSCFCPGWGPEQLLAEARAWAVVHEKPRLKFHTNVPVDFVSHRRLRLGYVSMDFRNHVVGRNVLPIVQHHDQNAFEIHCFSLVTRPDTLTAQFKDSGNSWHECKALNEAALAEKIRNEKIDILIDLTLHMQDNRLTVFARKPAPVQVTWAGYPGTTGLQSIDFRITDPYLDPPGVGDEFYSEVSIRLPNSFWCYRPFEHSPEVNELPCLAADHITFGCLNHFSKVNLASMNLWSAVLVAVPGSCMRILCPVGAVRAEIHEKFAADGVDPARIEFVDRQGLGSYLREFGKLDICLDPVPYTGHTTTLDALWMGVPVVSLSGQTSVSRGSVTALCNTGLSGLIAHSPAEYISKAESLATDYTQLTSIRSELRQRLQNSAICDEKGFTRDLESAYKKMWQSKGGNSLPDLE